MALLLAGFLALLFTRDAHAHLRRAAPSPILYMSHPHKKHARCVLSQTSTRVWCTPLVKVCAASLPKVKEVRKKQRSRTVADVCLAPPFLLPAPPASALVWRDAPKTHTLAHTLGQPLRSPSPSTAPTSTAPPQEHPRAAAAQANKQARGAAAAHSHPPPRIGLRAHDPPPPPPPPLPSRTPPSHLHSQR